MLANTCFVYNTTHETFHLPNTDKGKLRSSFDKLLKHRLTLLICTIIISISISNVAYSQTYVRGYVWGSFTKQNSPYIVDSTITIDFGDSLIVEPGVTVHFDSSAYFIVRGKLVCNGTPNEMVTLTTRNPQDSNYFWLGIVRDYFSSEPVILNFVILEKVLSQIIPYGNFSFSNCTIRNCGQFGGPPPSVYSSGRGFVTNCLFTNNKTNLFVHQYSELNIKNCQFIDNESTAAGAILREHGTIGKTIIKNSLFKRNKAPDGGAISLFSTGDLLIDSCTFEDCETSLYGGAINIYLGKGVVIQKCIFRNNHTSTYPIARGGAIATHKCFSGTIIRDNLFENNISSEMGGAIHQYSGCNAWIINNRFIRNKSQSGAAISAFMYCSPRIQWNQFIENVAGYEGGAIYVSEGGSLSINQNVFSKNSAFAKGGAISLKSADVTVLKNNTFFKNSAGFGGALNLSCDGGLYIYNSIIWGNSPSSEQVVIFSSLPECVVGWCDVENGRNAFVSVGTTVNYDQSNISGYPQFVDTLNNNLNLLSGSPCINSGDPMSRLDIDNSRNDMGGFGGGGQMPNGLLGGEITGIIDQNGSPYYVSEDLIVKRGESLTIKPGVTFAFRGPYKFYVYGEIQANGTKSDSIHFKNDPLLSMGRWRGLFLDGNSGSSSISYSSITGSAEGGCQIMKSSIVFQNVRVSDNIRMFSGAGIFIDGGNPKIEECQIIRNRSQSNSGGGITISWCLNPGITINRCLIAKNSSKTGGGILSTYSDVTFQNCTIVDNIAPFGGGIYASGGGQEIKFVNSIIAFNQNDQIRTGIPCYFTYSNPSGYPSTLHYKKDTGGDFIMGRGNIYSAPAFISSVSDYPYLLHDTSNCIDAGDSSVIYNDVSNPNQPGFALFPAKGGIRNDMGHHGGHNDIAMALNTKDEQNSDISKDFVLSQNYPNPFNPETIIEFTLATGAHVNLTVFNVVGEVVATLVDDFMASGNHRMVFNGNGLSSGIYFYRIRSEKFSKTMKMLLIR